MLVVDHLVESIQTLHSIRGSALLSVVSNVADRLAATLHTGRKILTCGNGGSAADAQHFAAELVGRYSPDYNRPPFAAVCLSSDPTTLTALGNDFGFEQVFAKQVRAIGNPGDALVVFSTSGKSPNVLKALAAARVLKLTTVGFCGANGFDNINSDYPECDFTLRVPAVNTALIQQAHQVLYHAICGQIEWKLMNP